MEDQSNGRHLRKGDTSLASKGFSWSTQSKGPKPVLWSLCCLGEARFSLLIFIAGRKWVHMRVVEEGMVTVSPGEGLNPPRRGRHSTWAASTRGGPGPAAERPETLTAPPTPSWNYTGGAVSVSGLSAAGPGPPRVEAAHVEWRPRRGGFSSDVEGPHLLRGAARGGSEHAQRVPQVAARRARETPVRCLPSPAHQDQALPLGRR